MRRPSPWHYTDVPRLGAVILSQKAINRLWEASATREDLEQTLLYGRDIKDPTVPHGGYREYDGIRLVFRTAPQLPDSAVVCIDGYRVKP